MIIFKSHVLCIFGCTIQDFLCMMQPYRTLYSTRFWRLATCVNYTTSKHVKCHETQSTSIYISVGFWSAINITQLHACLIFWDGWQFAWEASFRNLSMLVSHEIWISLADQTSICMQDVHSPVGVCVCLLPKGILSLTLVTDASVRVRGLKKSWNSAHQTVGNHLLVAQAETSN